MPAEVIGKPIDRVDGRLKVTGAARYSAEFPVKNLHHGWIVQSTIMSGKVASIDTSAAEKTPGVVCVMTHTNAPKIGTPQGNFGSGGVFAEQRLPLADGVVHHAGQHLAVVVADTIERARHAASLVKVTYDDVTTSLPTLREAMEGASEPGDWFGEQLQYKRGDVDAAISAAGKDGVVFEGTYETPAETHNPMEPSATIAHFEGDNLTVYDATQWIVGTQAILANVFELSKDNVRVICPFVGGGFGCKGFIWPHTILAVMAARMSGKPVKINLTRAQMFTSCGHRPETIQKMTLAAGKDGKLTAIKHETTTYTSKVAEYVEACGQSTSRLVYKCDNVFTPHKIARRHVASPTFMRAPAETPGMFALESAMDELSYALKMDPLDLRRANFAEVNGISNRAWSSNFLLECYDVGADKFGWKSRKPEPRATRDGDHLVGYGMATATFPGLRFPASARVRYYADGKVVAGSSTHDLGTGAYTVFTQVTAESLGVPVENVTFELGDSTLPRGPLAGGSNSSATVSEAIVNAVDDLHKKMIEAAIADAKSPVNGIPADDVEARDGKVIAKADDAKSEPFTAIIARAGKPFIEGSASAAPTAEMRKHAFQSFGAHFVEVRVDELLGRVRVSRVFSAIDVGRILNHKLAKSQIQGSVVMGIGMALMEHTVFDSRTGRPVTDSLADYAVPVNADIRDIDVYFTDKADPYLNRVGCRGVGEIGITGVAAAVANAVFHATGKRVRKLPITPDALL